MTNKNMLRESLGFVIWGVSIFYAFMLLGLGFRWLGFDWNTTESVALGIYRRTDAPLTQGQLISFCLPTPEATFGAARGYIHRVPWWSLLRECSNGYQPLLKHIVAVAGDVVDITAEGVLVNDVLLPYSATQTRDSQGRPLLHVLWGEYEIQPGELWVMSTLRSNSWDSRYFGAIRGESVIATAEPVWTWDTAEAGQ